MRASASEAAWTTTKATATTWTAMTTRTSVKVTTCIPSTKSIETIDDMQHRIRVDAIVLNITTQPFVEGTTEIALVMQDIIEL